MPGGKPCCNIPDVERVFVFFRISIAVFALLVLGPSMGKAQEQRPVEARYVGHRGYGAFTRLVFETSGLPPERFKLNFDPEGRRVVFYPEEGMLTLSFAPSGSVDELVREVDFVEDDEGRRGIVVRLGQAAGWPRVAYLSEPDRLVLDIYAKSAPKPFMAYRRPVKIAAIDPGHGGRFTGSGTPGKLTEKDLALDMAVRLKKALTQKGFTVVLTRDSDREANPDDRAGIANSAHADLYVSLHAGGSFGPLGRGAAVYTMDAGEVDSSQARGGVMSWDEQNAPYLPDSVELAQKVQGALGKPYGLPVPVRQAPLAGFGGLAMPAVLVELGSLAEPAEAESLSEEAMRNKLAAGIAAGIEAYAKGAVK